MIINRQSISDNKVKYMIYNSNFKYEFTTTINKTIDKILVCIFKLKHDQERWF